MLLPSSLTLHVYPTATEFLARMQPHLEAQEAVYGLMLGVALTVARDPKRYGVDAPYFATVEDGDGIVAAAAMTPPYGVILYSERPDPQPGLDAIAHNLLEHSWFVFGVNARVPLGAVFAAAWTRLTGTRAAVAVEERVFALREVIHPVYSPGRMRPATPDDLELVAQWNVDFVAEALAGHACRATPEKGVSVLFQAFNRISTKTLGPRPALVYVGDGPQLSALQALRNTLRCSKDIYLVGYRKDALTILEGADLCVIPSIWQDAFPLSVLETMALGKPVIGTRVGGIPEMVEHGRTGLLVPPSDDIALSEAIRELLVDPFRAAQLGAAARQRVRDFFTREQQLADLTTILVKGFGLKCLAQER